MQSITQLKIQSDMFSELPFQLGLDSRGINYYRATRPLLNIHFSKGFLHAVF